MKTKTTIGIKKEHKVTVESLLNQQRTSSVNYSASDGGNTAEDWCEILTLRG